MLNPQQKELIQVFTPVASALVATVGIGVAVWLSVLQRRIQDGQRKIQEGQLKHSLFDKRFAVFQACEQYLVRIMQKNGKLDMTDLQFFAPEVEKAGFLFGADAVSYMNDLKEKANEVYVKAGKAAHLDSICEYSVDAHLEVSKMMQDFCGAMVERRKTVFGPYLRLEG